MRLANIWNATSMPMVKPWFFITSSAPTHRMPSVMVCSSALAATLKLLDRVRVEKPAAR